MMRRRISRPVHGLAALIVLGASSCAPAESPSAKTKASPGVRSTGAAALALTPAESVGPVTWPTPAGWEHETIPFPLEFARSLPFKGVEELRFAPGFYKPSEPGYWSYDILWWLLENPELDAPKLASALTAYFRGLSTSVGGTKFRFDSTQFRTTLTESESVGRRTIRGQVFTFDAFTSGLPIVLNVEAEMRACPTAGRYAVILQFSPQPTSAPIWTALRSTAAGVVCK